MTNKQFPVQFSVPSSIALEKEILSRYNIPKPYTCKFYTQGLNDIFIIKAQQEIYYLRISNYNWTTKEELLAEIELLNYLHEYNMSIALPVQDMTGTYVHKLNAPEGIRYAVLFTEAKGDCIYDLSIEQNKIFGRQIAKFHTYSDNIQLKHNRHNIDKKNLIDEPLKIIKPYLLHRIADYEYLKDTGNCLTDLIKNKLTKAKPYYGICHGDFHNGNIRFTKGNILTIFDFDCFGYGWRAYDLAVYLWSKKAFQQSTDNESSDQRKWESFLDGYNGVRSLDKNELEAIDVFVVMREIWFLGIQLRSLDMNRGCEWLNEGFYDYHIKFIKEWIENIS